MQCVYGEPVHVCLCVRVLLSIFHFILLAEYNYYNTGLIPSKFYASLTARDDRNFRESVYQSLIIVASACIVSLFLLVCMTPSVCFYSVRVL